MIARPGRLFTLSAIAMLPVALFGLAIAAYLSVVTRDNAEGHLRDASRAIAATVDRQIARDTVVLATAATSDAFDRHDYRQLALELRRVLAGGRTWPSIGLVDMGGLILEEKRADGVVGFRPRPDMEREALRLGGPVVGGIVSGGAGAVGDSVPLRVPAVRTEGTGVVLGVDLPAESFRPPLLENLGDPAPWAFLIDADNRLITCASLRGPCPLPPGSRLGRAAIDAKDGVAFEGTAGDRDYVMVTAPVSIASWKVIAATPLDDLARRLTLMRGVLAAGALAAGVIGIIVATMMSRAFLGRDMAERRLEAMEGEREAERRLAGMTRGLPGILFRRVRLSDGLSLTRCVADVENVFRMPASRGVDDASGRMLERMMTPETARRWTEAFEKAAPSGDAVQMEGDLIDAEERPRRFRVNATARKRPDGSVIWDGVIIDITDLREAEAARRLTMDQLAFALEHADAGIWEWDLRRDRCVWSDGLWRLFGYQAPVENPTLRAIEARLHPDDVETYWSGLDAMLVNGGDNRMEFRVLLPDGSVRWIASRARTALDSAGAPTSVIGLDIDITQMRRYQEEMRAAKEEAERADAAKSRFLAAASHDLRQPVQSLMLLAHVLSQKLAGHESAELMTTMRAALDALKELLDSILDLSRLDAGIIETATVETPLSAVMSRLAAEYGPRFGERGLRLRVFHPSATIVVDPTLLARIVGNLVENALKYTRKGGVLVGARRRGDEVRIEVWDTGIGIPSDKMEDIFGEFVQLGNPERDRARGLGLGLAIVRRLARLLGYTLDVRSREGRGSMFAVTVPLGRSTRTPTDAGPASAPARIEAASIVPAPPASRSDHAVPPAVSAVVIDDERFVLEGLRAMLEDWGCQVVAEADDDAALARLEAEGIIPGLLICDYRLSGGRTGVDVIRRLRERYGVELPAVLLTGDTGLQVDMERLGKGVRIVRKPVSPREFRRLIAEIAAGG